MKFVELKIEQKFQPIVKSLNLMHFYQILEKCPLTIRWSDDVHQFHGLNSSEASPSSTEQKCRNTETKTMAMARMFNVSQCRGMFHSWICWHVIYLYSRWLGRVFFCLAVEWTYLMAHGANWVIAVVTDSSAFSSNHQHFEPNPYPWIEFHSLFLSSKSSNESRPNVNSGIGSVNGFRPENWINKLENRDYFLVFWKIDAELVSCQPNRGIH